LRDLWLAVLLGAVFVAAFFAVEWPFASFLITTHSRNWFFNGDNYVYFMSPQWVERTFHFADWEPWSRPLAPQLAIAVGMATLSSYLGLKWGRWMTHVRR
jgi:peptidoglycan/LPS O-acetylase OafA/YrhL